jgi:hypothetical protein
VVKGVDGRQHIEYDLIITNVFTTDVTLQSIEVLDGRGRHLTTLEGDALAAVTTRIFGAEPTAKVESSATAQTVVDVVLPRGVEVPERLTHRVSYDFPKGALFEQLIGSHEVAGPTLEVQRRHEIVVSPPLRGSGWIAVNACCEPSSHRSFLLSANGGLVTPEVFAIDFIQTRDGRLAEGDGSQNEQWFGHGTRSSPPPAGRSSPRATTCPRSRPERAPPTTRPSRTRPTSAATTSSFACGAASTRSTAT